MEHEYLKTTTFFSVVGIAPPPLFLSASTGITVIRFVSTSAKSGICTAVVLIGSFVEAKMRTFVEDKMRTF